MPYRVPTMRPLGAPSKPESDRLYDRTRRDPRAKKFYNSQAWQRARRCYLATNPILRRVLEEG